MICNFLYKVIEIKMEETEVKNLIMKGLFNQESYGKLNIGRFSDLRIIVVLFVILDSIRILSYAELTFYKQI